MVNVKSNVLFDLSLTFNKIKKKMFNNLPIWNKYKKNIDIDQTIHFTNITYVQPYTITKIHSKA